MPIYDKNLWEYFKSFDRANRNIPMPERFSMFEKCLAGLTYIQNTGFKHLDIKLGNVLIRTNPADGTWDGTNLVITDFGVGGTPGQETEMAGTPGAASPEQLVGKAHQKSDNYSFGRLIVFLFAKWETAWNLQFRPRTDIEIANINFDQRMIPAFEVVRQLLQVCVSL